MHLSALRISAILATGLCPWLAGCLAWLPSDGGGEEAPAQARSVDPGGVGLPEGYRIEVVRDGLTFPTCVFVDDDDRVYVVEGGYAYGEQWRTPRVLRLDAGGGTAVVAEGDNPPWNGALWHDGAIYVVEGGNPGRVLRYRDGVRTVLVDDLPPLADHHASRPALGPDGWIYFGQGTATNSGVVGTDNATFGWLGRTPGAHDVPGRDIVLTGRNYTTADPLTGDPDDTATTGAFVPFGTATEPGQVIPGRVPCTGAVLRVHPVDGALELVAWGLRNPYDLEFAPDGTLYALENGCDERGSRPVFGAPDCVWRIEPEGWYGWPDFCAGIPLTEPRFASDGDAPGFLLAEHPQDPPEPVALLGVHASANGMAIISNPAFGFAGQALVAQFGDMAPGVGKVTAPVGFNVVRVDLASGEIEGFAANRGDENGPASRQGGGGLERPIDVCFDRSGTALYVLDFGILSTEPEVRAVPGTGVLWRIVRRSPTP